MEIDLSKLTPDVRRLSDMREVFKNQEWAKTAKDKELYYMYRGLDSADGLRYDITIIPPAIIGGELVKTKGHFHIGEYQEVYIVLEGSGLFLMQKMRGGESVEDFYVVEAEQGDVVVIPANYGHVTVNYSAKNLKLANWISENCKSDYSLYEKMRGACYYYVSRGGDTMGWEKNPNYKNVPDVKYEQALRSVPRNLDFLKKG